MKRKTFYEPPVCSSVCMQMEAFICGSVEKSFTTPHTGDVFSPITGSDITEGDFIF